MTFRPPDPAHPLYGRFWHDAPDSELWVPWCTACGRAFWPPAEVCPRCLGDGVAWQRAAGTGTTWAVAEYWRGYSNGLADEVPYRCVLVELDVGPRLISRYVGDDPPVPGTRVVATRIDMGEYSLPCFTAL